MRTRIPFRELHLVAESFARVEGRAPALTVAFFACLFKLRPHLRRTFPDKDYDKRTFAATFFRFIVEHLDSEEELGELLERFGQRGLLDHVTLEDSDAIGRSILGALCELGRILGCSNRPRLENCIRVDLCGHSRWRTTLGQRPISMMVSQVANIFTLIVLRGDVDGVAKRCWPWNGKLRVLVVPDRATGSAAYRMRAARRPFILLRPNGRVALRSSDIATIEDFLRTNVTI